MTTRQHGVYGHAPDGWRATPHTHASRGCDAGMQGTGPPYRGVMGTHEAPPRIIQYSTRDGYL